MQVVNPFRHTVLTTFSSHRPFQLVSYSGDRGTLLLRSRQYADKETRIDVLFQDVRALEIRCWTEGLEIVLESPEYLDQFASRPRQLLEPGNLVYAVTGRGWHGFILGGALTAAEDRRKPGDPSSLLEAGGREPKSQRESGVDRRAIEPQTP